MFISLQNLTLPETFLSLSELIWALFAGFLLAATAATVDRIYCNAFVKALVTKKADAPETALPLEELITSGKGYLKFALKPGKHLYKMVDVCIAEGEAPRYYLPEEKRVAAELRYENGPHPIRTLILCAILLVALAILMHTLLPDLLVMLDNMMTQL